MKTTSLVLLLVCTLMGSCTDQGAPTTMTDTPAPQEPRAALEGLSIEMPSSAPDPIANLPWKSLVAPIESHWKHSSFETDAGETGLLKMSLLCEPTSVQILDWMSVVDNVLNADYGLDVPLHVKWLKESDPEALYIAGFTWWTKEELRLPADIMDARAEMLCTPELSV